MTHPKNFSIALLSSLFLILPLLLANSAVAEDVSYEDLARETQEGIERLSFLNGDWEVAAFDENNKPQFQTTSKIRSIMNGKVLEERAVAYWDDRTWDMVILRTYDPFQKKYRMAAVDNIVGMLDVYEGRFEGDVLRESNLETGTFTSPEPGSRIYFRNQMKRISDDHFVIDTEYSSDAGKTWKAAGRFVYKRTN